MQKFSRWSQRAVSSMSAQGKEARCPSRPWQPDILFTRPSSATCGFLKVGVVREAYDVFSHTVPASCGSEVKVFRFCQEWFDLQEAFLNVLALLE
mmetsp:Transcript_45216/g.144884  ORF Transcript_45216/g.144884 Transcript_45216/m.144884 type:complete len:95 (-) Transcript_45216:929-1213(-)